MEDEDFGDLVPLEAIIMGFAIHISSGNEIDTVHDEALYNLHEAVCLEIEKREAVLHRQHLK